MTHEQRRVPWRMLGAVLSVAGLACIYSGIPLAQSEQVVEVTIKDFKFITKQDTLRLGLPTVITVRNDDAERHDFGSNMFEGVFTKVEREGVVVYGHGISGVFLGPKGAASIRFNMSRPGRYEFRCSIHNIKGELLLLNMEAA